MVSLSRSTARRSSVIPSGPETTATRRTVDLVEHAGDDVVLGLEPVDHRHQCGIAVRRCGNTLVSSRVWWVVTSRQ